MTQLETVSGNAELIEHLADKAHASWARWMAHLFRICEKRPDGSVVIPSLLVERWQRQIATPYAQLSEHEKRSDRDEVDQLLPVLRAHGLVADEKPPEPRIVRVYFLLDESGSMGSRASDVRGGFNSYVENLRGDGNTYSLTAVKFGSSVRPLFANLPLDQVPALTTENYLPQDSTALYDAIGYTLAEARKHFGAQEKPYGSDPVFFIIMTDGEENSSKEFSKQAIVDKIKRREKAGNWTFVYLGADQDAWAIAPDLGLAKGNVMSYASGETQAVFRSLSTATSTSATSGIPATSHFFGGNINTGNPL